ncbi:hypothetical protein VTJ83DRAFT_650 [Remersonia thermophila]|uniref:Uncharacterized protein n=1 Tax=Remersonia thermophila TaxID=72144 RepID=A0ABR4DMF3_9PEZI
MDQHSGPAALLRGFKFPDLEAPKTPEPFATKDDAEIPSPPRPRLRLRRRVTSQLTAPTQHFLASVAAADVPIPSIEEPEIRPDDYDDKCGRIPFPAFCDEPEEDLRYLRPRSRTLAAPKTPAPELEEALPRSRFPNWTLNSASSLESTPEPDYESSRPSTARSTLTSASLFSRFSDASDDESDDDAADVAQDKDHCPAAPGETTSSEDRLADPRGKARKAPWTKAMSDHLWSTYMLYLQDPKVTPFRMGKNGIPPQGVCLRVAREAKRSWKGSKALLRASKLNEGKSGSATPTAENSGTFIQWPHTCAATRAHLRELCRLRANSRASNHRFAGPGTAPFSQAAARHWNRRSPMPFATQEMSLSLVVSTADSMQPNGPLAQLAAAPLNPEPEPTTTPTEPSRPAVFTDPSLNTTAPEGEPSFAERRRLGSPFASSSYGPSSSGSLAAVLGLGSMPRRQSQTMGPRRTLQSPVRLSRSGMQKRRHTQSGVPRKRPSIGSDLWLDPSFAAATAAAATLSRETSSSSDRPEGLFIPKMPSVPTLSSSTSMPNVGGSASGKLDDSALQPPPRLGSPFVAEKSSFSFPHRVHRSHQAGSIDLGVLGRPFGSMYRERQQTADSSMPPPPSRNASLADRLAYIDQRLKELRQRETRPRRSESPF